MHVILLLLVPFLLSSPERSQVPLRARYDVDRLKLYTRCPSRTFHVVPFQDSMFDRSDLYSISVYRSVQEKDGSISFNERTSSIAGEIYLPGLISMHSSGRQLFFTQTFGAQHGLMPNLHGTQFRPASRVSNDGESSSSSLVIERRNMRAFLSDSSMSLSLSWNKRLASDVEITTSKANRARAMLVYMVVEN